MAQHFTSSTLIASVKRRAMIPANQSTFTDADFLAFANEEISLGLLPSILRLHEDYYLFVDPVDMSGNSTGRFQIPHRAIGNKLRDVQYEDTSGNISEMTRIGIHDQPEYIGPYTNNRVHAFYVEGNNIVLRPEITGPVQGNLLMIYYLRPSELVDEDQASTITAIDRDTGVITVDQIPDGFTTSIKYDFVKAKSPFTTYSIELTATNIDTLTNEYTFATDDIPDNLEVGDYINKECETIVPQIPADLHVVLAHRVAARCLEALGDVQGLQVANQKLAEMESNTTNLIDNRVEAAPKKVVNRHGLLRSGLYRKRWKYRS